MRAGARPARPQRDLRGPHPGPRTRPHAGPLHAPGARGRPHRLARRSTPRGSTPGSPPTPACAATATPGRWRTSRPRPPTARSSASAGSTRTAPWWTARAGPRRPAGSPTCGRTSCRAGSRSPPRRTRARPATSCCSATRARATPARSPSACAWATGSSSRRSLRARHGARGHGHVRRPGLHGGPPLTVTADAAGTVDERDEDGQRARRPFAGPRPARDAISWRGMAEPAPLRQPRRTSWSPATTRRSTRGSRTATSASWAPPTRSAARR